MAEKVKVLLVDDNKQLLMSLKDYFAKQTDVEVCGIAENGQKAIEFLKSSRADVMILDMIMPEMDGMAVLDWLANSEIEHIPDVIVATALGHEDIVRRASEMGVKYFMMKPISADQLHKRILEIRGRREIKRALPAKKPVNPTSMNEEITSIFLTIGIPAHIKGYQFLREGVKLVVENREIINSITKQLYPGIAKHFNTTSSKVERAIRHAINVAWTRGKLENIDKIFGYNIFNKNEKPTNGEFIALITEKVLLEKQTSA
jgi:two-component system, response regulator, stage 0 sporulation protein A